MSPPSADDRLSAATQGLRVVAHLIGVIAAVAAILFVVDRGLRLFESRTNFVQREVEIQGPATLFAKISDMMRVPAERRIALLGDSLIFGSAMQQAGVSNWREQNLAAHLRSEMTAKSVGPVEIFNLGMNGALPADIEKIVNALSTVGVRAVVLDVNLRHFSRDFASPQTTLSRPWLANFRISSGGLLLDPHDGGAFDSAVDTLAVNYWYTYRVRDQLRLWLLGQSPYELVQNLRDRINSLFRPGGDLLDSDMRQILNARARYSDIVLAPENPQIAALTRLVRKLRDEKVPTVIFYATERPDVIDSITDPTLHRQRLAQLADIIERNRGKSVVYLGPLGTLVPDDFIDHVHVLPAGYRKYSEMLAQRLTELTNAR